MLRLISANDAVFPVWHRAAAEGALLWGFVPTPSKRNKFSMLMCVIMFIIGDEIICCYTFISENA
jgi:hypothetical protein